MYWTVLNLFHVWVPNIFMLKISPAGIFHYRSLQRLDQPELSPGTRRGPMDDPMVNIRHPLTPASTGLFRTPTRSMVFPCFPCPMKSKKGSFQVCEIEIKQAEEIMVQNMSRQLAVAPIICCSVMGCSCRSFACVTPLVLPDSDPNPSPCCRHEASKYCFHYEVRRLDSDWSWQW